MTRKATALLCLAFATLEAACVGPGSPSSREGDRPGSASPVAQRRIGVAVSTVDPVMFRSEAGGAFGGTAPGIDNLEDLLHAGLANRDDSDTLRPRLAEELPSIENGLWTVFSDGHMETTWRIKPRAQWHDGTPFTTDDLLFTLRIIQDRETLAFSAHPGVDVIDGAEALDTRTLRVVWRRPFIDADALFTSQFAMPMPRHLLEPPYAKDKAGLVNQPYWNHEFVGTGPFMLRDWLIGSQLVLTAFDGYILGRPKIDEVTVRFIPDANTLAANLLAGEVDVNLGRGLSLDQGVEVAKQWHDGALQVGLTNWVVLYPQFVNPDPPVIADARFRRALMYALDRQAMADALQGGLTPVAHAIFNTSVPLYRDLDSRVVRYSYDPGLAARIITDIGYTRGPDGAFRDGSGQRLGVEIRTTGDQDLQMKSASSAADYWQKVGVGTETLVIPVQRLRDREYQAARPGFFLIRTPDGSKGLRRLRSSETPLAENNYTKSGNDARYMNPAFDALLDRYFSTVPTGERREVLGEIIQHMTDDLTVMGLYWGANPTLTARRLQNVRPRNSGEGTEAWNAHEWDVTV